jgi:hypothetical protein
VISVGRGALLRFIVKSLCCHERDVDMVGRGLEGGELELLNTIQL